MDEYTVQGLINDVRGDMHRIQDEMQRQIWDLEKELYNKSCDISNLEERVRILESDDGQGQYFHRQINTLIDQKRDLDERVKILEDQGH